MRRVSMRAMSGMLAIVGFVFMLPVAQTHGDLTNCGYVAMVDCPGCAPSNPAGGCVCGPNSGSCDCRKITGGLQTDIKTICHNGPFNWLTDPNGYVINQGNSVPCSENRKCMKVDGGQTNCAEMGMGGLCRYGSGSTTPCDWRLFGNVNEQPTFEIGAPCNPEGQN
jgi:hypothetical protein